MKKLFFTLLLFIVPFAMNAEHVSPKEALQKAQHFMPGKQFSELRSYTRSNNNGGFEPFYIFNADDQKGFVIVSGDDRTEPILGYSYSGMIDYDNMPDNFTCWLDDYSKQINSLSKDYQYAKPQRTRGDMTPIEPLIQTRWNQGAPYNLMCPLDDGKRCVTGCVATAMAQVMYFHKWPECSMAIPGYITDSRQISLDELPTTTFKWDKMKTSYEYNETGESVDAVAELMRYCGQALRMDYTSIGSGAGSPIRILYEFFSYSNNMKIIYRSDFINEQWESIIYQELKENRPVLYCGSSKAGSHEFICDGNDGNGLFHINWGWGGYCDGFFVLSAADPNKPNIDGEDSIDGFKNGQSATIGIKPGFDGEVEIPNVYNFDFNFFIQSYNNT